MKISVKVGLGYTLELSLVFGARLCWGGGGNVTFHDIQDSAGMFIIDIRPLLLGLSMMWRDQLSRDSRVVYSLAFPARSWRERRSLLSLRIVLQ